MSNERNSGRRGKEDVSRIRAILGAVFSRLNFTVTGSGADQMSVTQSGGDVVIDFNPDPSGGGASAYEIAVENGFEGTEEEWLASLQGADGADGANGVDGADGANGVDGADGVDGDSAYAYVGYASDDAGADYSSSPGPGLGYVAFKASSTALTPIASDFVGLWKKYVGEDGAGGADGVDGVDGVDGASAYVYIAYASDASGSDFTMTFTPTLDYIAILSTDTEIPSPVVGDFAGLWVKYLGTDGADGADGAAGFQWDAFTSTSTAIASRAHFDAALASSVTTLKISYTAAIGSNQSAYLLAFGDGDRLHVTFPTAAAHFTISGTPTDDSGNSQVIFTLTGGTGIAVPSDGDRGGFVFIKDGVDGVDGVDGTNGSAGATGAAGAHGGVPFVLNSGWSSGDPGAAGFAYDGSYIYFNDLGESAINREEWIQTLTTGTTLSATATLPSLFDVVATKHFVLSGPAVDQTGYWRVPYSSSSGNDYTDPDDDGVTYYFTAGLKGDTGAAGSNGTNGVGLFTGATTFAMRATPPTGWIYSTGTIGNASSGATTRANADTEDLFTVLWNDFSDTYAPVSGGRGASAAADFAANKTIGVPDARGRILAAKDDMGGTAASIITVAGSGINGTTLGLKGGSETHTLTSSESGVPAHTHAISATKQTNTATGGGGSRLTVLNNGDTGNEDATSGSNTAADAASAHNNMPPVLILPLFVML